MEVEHLGLKLAFILNAVISGSGLTARPQHPIHMCFILFPFCERDGELPSVSILPSCMLQLELVRPKPGGKNSV